jgi:putative tryptophan/tyrosine transport system substrate-binding protein
LDAPEVLAVRRRDFISLLGRATAALPFAAHAQQPAIPVVGFMHAGVAAAHTHVVAALRQGLKESGYVEGQNLAIEYRWANNELDRLPELAADLVRRQVNVIAAAGGAPTALAAKAATSAIPIVLAFGADPVRLGLVASLSRPGGNVTGVTFITTELMTKRLDLLRELVPQAATVAYLGDTRSAVGQAMLSEIQAAAGVLGRQLAVAEAGSEREFEAAFATFVERRSGALVVSAAVLFDSHWTEIPHCSRAPNFGARQRRFLSHGPVQLPSVIVRREKEFGDGSYLDAMDRSGRKGNVRWLTKTRWFRIADASSPRCRPLARRRCSVRSPPQPRMARWKRPRCASPRPRASASLRNISPARC